VNESDEAPPKFRDPSERADDLAFESVLRALPGKRVAGLASHGGRPVFAKVYMGSGGRRRAARELAAARRLEAFGLPVAAPLVEQPVALMAADGAPAAAALFERLDGRPIAAGFRDGAGDGDRVHRLLGDALAVLHESGFAHTDPHPANFIVGEDRLWIVDVGALRRPLLGLSDARRRENLIATLAAFDPSHDVFAAAFLEAYDRRAQAALADALAPKLEALLMAHRRRLRAAFRKKVLRPSSAVRRSAVPGGWVLTPADVDPAPFVARLRKIIAEWPPADADDIFDDESYATYTVPFAADLWSMGLWLHRQGIPCDRPVALMKPALRRAARRVAETTPPAPLSRKQARAAAERRAVAEAVLRFETVHLADEPCQSVAATIAAAQSQEELRSILADFDRLARRLGAFGLHVKSGHTCDCSGARVRVHWCNDVLDAPDAGTAIARSWQALLHGVEKNHPSSPHLTALREAITASTRGADEKASYQPVEKLR
jgi:tRNA A-37 threonylcarbamoyl transferase component Bud32